MASNFTPVNNESRRNRKKKGPLNLTQGGANAPVFRHVPFVPNLNTALAPSKVNSNTVNATGTYKLCACIPCLQALGSFNETKRVGRGVLGSNEYFSCLVHPDLGVGGKQCARCLGLGKGDECIDPPDEAYEHVRAIVRVAYGYNQALTRNSRAAFDTWPADDQKSARDAKEAGEAFSRFMVGYRNRAEEVPSPSKRRKTTSQSDEMTDTMKTVSNATDVTLAQMKNVSMAVSTVHKNVQKLMDEVEDVKDLLKASRERERWLVDAVGKLVGGMNEFRDALKGGISVIRPATEQVANEDGETMELTVRGFEHIRRIRIEDFDLSKASFAEDEISNDSS